MSQCEEQEIIGRERVDLSAEQIKYSDGTIEFRFETAFLPPLKLIWSQQAIGQIVEIKKKRTPKKKIKPTNPRDFWDQVNRLPWNPVPDSNGDVKCQLVKARRRKQIVVECRGGCPGGSNKCKVILYGWGNKIGAKCSCK